MSAWASPTLVETVLVLAATASAAGRGADR